MRMLSPVSRFAYEQTLIPSSYWIMAEALRLELSKLLWSASVAGRLITSCFITSCHVNTIYLVVLLCSAFRSLVLPP